MVRISLLCLALLTPALAHDIAPNAHYTVTGDTVCAPTRNGTQVCYPKVFEPTADFQVVLPGQDIPAGLHVQIDMATGLKKAKIIEGDDRHALAVVPEPPQEEFTAEPVRMGQMSSDEVKQRLDQVIMLADRQMNYVTEDAAIAALDELEDLMHDSHKAERLARDPMALPALLTLASPSLHKGLQPWPPRIRQLASTVLGSTVQNNDKLQTVAVNAGVLPRLLRILASEPNAKAASKHIYALSALVRGHQGALEQFGEQGGLRTLAMVRPHGEGRDAHKLDIRIARFVEDLFTPEFNPHQSQDAVDLAAQQAAVWCSDLAGRLTNDMESLDESSERQATDERRLAYATALLRIKHQHPLTCSLPAALRPWVRAEAARVARTDNDEYKQALEALGKELH